ncbi:hypothetical protein [Xanthobacter sp. KR7-225]|uniref:hypothetical protein n=1 Tax=Xanthobacter sp. KR7-225 TaxID=3156613 RepID=UPI0032B52D98
MPDFRISPISIVNQIKSNLQDRYDSGYPILKELLQNADDAEAQRFRLDVLPSWPNAVNPLLRGPGLLVANDGFFRKQDESGITSFGAIAKPPTMPRSASLVSARRPCFTSAMRLSSTPEGKTATSSARSSTRSWRWMSQAISVGSGSLSTPRCRILGR